MVSSLDKLHYSFCGDLGDKAILKVKWPESINFALFRIKQMADGSGSGRTIPNSEIFIPGLYVVEKITSDNLSNLFKSQEYQTFIAPADYSTQELFYVREKQLFIPIPDEVFQHPHLPTHATFQFYFLNNSLFTANLLYLDVGDFEGNGSKQLRVHWTAKSSPSGTYVFFRSEYIFFAWKIEVRQGIVNISLIDEVNKVMNKVIDSAVKEIPVFGGMISGAKKGVDAMTQSIAENFVYGKDTWNQMGLDKERISRIRELQTARMFQSTSLTGESTLEPSIFYTNSENFSYNLFDFFLRAGFKPHWEARIHISKTLFNNLIHNNNANPITYPLDITFEKLGNILRPGKYKGGLDLDRDSSGKMAECFARGVTFYEDKKKHFVNPNLGLAGVRNDNIRLGAGGDNYIAQAITSGDEPWINEITRSKGTNYHQRAHFFITYEDGTNDHWLVLFPQSFTDNDLANGHHHGGFDIKFDKPVKEFIDVYTCIGCGAKSDQNFGQTTPGFLDLHRSYDGGNDSLDTIHKGLPYNPWYNKLTSASLQGSYWMTADNDRCLGSQGDVWEFTGQYIRGKDDKPFTEAYGFIPSGGTIQWTTKGSSTRIEWQKVPNQDDFSNLDWSPPAGSGGEIEIPLEDPEIAIPEPGEGETTPELDLPGPDYDVGGGEPEIPPIEPDLPPDIDPGLDPDDGQDIDPPPIEPDVPEVDPNEPDTGRDPEGDPGDHDPPPDFPVDDDDAD